MVTLSRLANTKKAINFYSKLYDESHMYDDAILGVTNQTKIDLGEPKILRYIS